eukprot:6270388-Amphidinium_carterae.1
MLLQISSGPVCSHQCARVFGQHVMQNQTGIQKNSAGKPMGSARYQYPPQYDEFLVFPTYTMPHPICSCSRYCLKHDVLTHSAQCNAMVELTGGAGHKARSSERCLITQTNYGM